MSKRKAETPKEKKGVTKLARTTTMGETMDEGTEFLSQTGYSAKPSETRTQQKIRETVDIMLAPDKRDITQLSKEELEKYKQELCMMFRLFNEKKDGHLIEKEMEEIFRAMGKNKAKSKVTQIFKTIDTKSTGFITKDQFVDYIINKRKLKAEKGKETQLTKKTPAKGTGKKEQVTEKKEDKTPTKKTPAKKTEKKEEPKKVEMPTSSTTPQTNTEINNLQKGLSLADFYTQYAGQHDEIVSENLDSNRNPVGREYDLGIEGAFKVFNIIIIYFHSTEDTYHKCEEALKSKGFNLTIAKNVTEFIEKLHDYDEAWIITGLPLTDNLTKFVEEVTKFHQAGKGVFIWADNEPYIYPSNLLLNSILPGVSISGNTPGGNILHPQPITASSKLPKTGHFARHLLTTGIVSLYEGITISCPSQIVPQMTIIGQSSDNNPCFFCVEDPGKGRLVVDCGFTKIFDHLWGQTAGTERYVRNCAVWLLGLEARIKLGAPLRGDIRSLESNTTTTTTEEVKT